MSRYFKGFLLAAAAVSPLGAAELPPAVGRALAAAGVPESAVGVVVQEVGAPRPALAVNARRALNPASTMKIVTTWAALEMLGPAFRWKTEVFVDGEDLVLRGAGDPKLDYESFWTLLRSLRSRGLRDLRGDLVLDRGRFAPAANGRFDDEAFRPYNVPPDALLLNFKSVRFLFLPDYDRGGVRVAAEPPLPGLAVTNTLRLGAGPCPEGRAFRDRIGAAFQSQPPRAAFTGTYPALCADRELNVALHQPDDYAAALMRLVWSELGGSWAGRVREGAPSPAAKLVYEHESAPLAEVVRDINKFSNNVMARQLFLTVAAEAAGAPASAENASSQIRSFLEKKGIRAPELVMENGSGLSRVERISAANLAAVLQAAWKSATMPELVSSLPVTAADGTMKKRLKGERVAGQAHIKTGLLNDARTMAGYVLDRHGRRHAVVMLVNHPAAPQSDAAQDALLAWVYEGAGSGAGATGRDRAKANPRGASPRHP